MTNNAKLLGTGAIGKLLFTYALPAIASMIIFSLYNVIDSIFIGHGVGTLAIAGMAATFPIMNIVIACGLLIGIGGASTASILLGEGKKNEATQVLGNVLTLSLGMSVILALIIFRLLDPLLLHFGASAATLHYGRDFMQVILLGLPVTYAMFNLNHMMRATGYPEKALMSAVVTVGVNLVLAPIFIFGLHWGIRGAALATVIAQVVGLAWVVLHFCNQSSFIRFTPGIYQPRSALVRKMFTIGLPPFLMNIGASVVVGAINAGLQSHGGDMAVGAYGIINRILYLCFMVIVGLTQGMQPIVGYNYGAQRFDRVKLTLRYGLYAGAGIMTLCMLICELLPEAIASMFTPDPALRSLCVTGLRITAMLFPLVGIQIVIGNFFQAIGMPKLSIFLALTRQMLFLLPCLIVLPRFFGVNGVWFSIPVSDGVAVVVAVMVLRRFMRKAELCATQGRCEEL